MRTKLSLFAVMAILGFAAATPPVKPEAEPTILGVENVASNTSSFRVLGDGLLGGKRTRLLGSLRPALLARLSPSHLGGVSASLIADDGTLTELQVDYSRSSPSAIVVRYPDDHIEGVRTLMISDLATNYSSVARVQFGGNCVALEQDPAQLSGPKKVSATAVPSVAGFSGTAWYFSISNPAWQGYLQAGYEDHSRIAISANGSGLDQITSVTTTAPGYAVKITSQSSSKLTLNIYGKALYGSGQYFNENSPVPVANFPLKFTYSGGSFSKDIRPGVIPAFNINNQAWGQCTWYAGYIARLRVGKSFVKSYNSFDRISGNPSNPGFPKVHSVLNASGNHMAFLESISSSSKANADGSVTITYTLGGTQYNAQCNNGQNCGLKSTFSTKMVVKQKNSTYSITTLPTVLYTITGVKQ